MLRRTMLSPNEARSLSREHRARNLWGWVGKRLKGQAQHGCQVARRGARTHRVVCEALQDDGSGEGVAGRAEARPGLTLAHPPQPTRVSSKGGCSREPGRGVRKQPEGARTAV